MGSLSSSQGLLYMKHDTVNFIGLVAGIALFLVGCTQTLGSDSAHSPKYEIEVDTTKTVVLTGCEKLKQRIEKWNKENPNDVKIVAC